MLILPSRFSRRFNPRRDLPGLKLWWDCGNPQTLLLEEPSTGDVRIRRMLDQSGNDNYGWIEDFQPWEFLYRIDSGGFYHARTGAGDWRCPNWSGSGMTEGTAIMVVKKSADPGSGGDWWTYSASSAGSASHYPFSDGLIYDAFGTTSRKTVGAFGPYNEWHIYSARSATNLWTANRNGVEIFHTATNTVAFDASLGGNSIFFNCSEFYLAEHLVFAKRLTAGELNSLGLYLGEKYRIKWNRAAR